MCPICGHEAVTHRDPAYPEGDARRSCWGTCLCYLTERQAEKLAELLKEEE